MKGSITIQNITFYISRIVYSKYIHKTICLNSPHRLEIKYVHSPQKCNPNITKGYSFHEFKYDTKEQVLGEIEQIEEKKKYEFSQDMDKYGTM